MSWVVRAQLHRNVDTADSRERKGDSMNWVRMSQGPQHGNLVHDPRHLGKQLANLAASETRRNGVQLTSNFDWCIRLGIYPFQLTWGPIEMNQNDGLRLAKRRRLFRRVSGRLQLKYFG
jgi:hypothetical protein